MSSFQDPNPSNNAQWILYNDGESYKLSYRSVMAPDTYIQVATFAPTVPYIIIDTIRFVLNKYYDEADETDGELFKEREVQWQPYLDNISDLVADQQQQQGNDAQQTSRQSGAGQGQYL